MSRFSKFFSLVGFKKTKRHKHKKQKRRNTRRRYIRGGWGGIPSIKLSDFKLSGGVMKEGMKGEMKKGVMKGVMKGGWGPAVPM